MLHNIALRRAVWIVAAGFAALLVLWPPWQDHKGQLLGHGPLLSPMQYSVEVGSFKPGVAPTYERGGVGVDRTTGLVRVEPDRLIDPG